MAQYPTSSTCAAGIPTAPTPTANGVDLKYASTSECDIRAAAANCVFCSDTNRLNHGIDPPGGAGAGPAPARPLSMRTLLAAEVWASAEPATPSIEHNVARCAGDKATTAATSLQIAESVKYSAAAAHSLRTANDAGTATMDSMISGSVLKPESNPGLVAERIERPGGSAERSTPGLAP
jgi:hypothetical protein